MSQLSKYLSIFNPKNYYLLSSQKQGLNSGSEIWDPQKTYPGCGPRGQKIPGSLIQIRNTASIDRYLLMSSCFWMIDLLRTGSVVQGNSNNLFYFFFSALRCTSGKFCRYFISVYWAVSHWSTHTNILNFTVLIRALGITRQQVWIDKFVWLRINDGFLFYCKITVKFYHPDPDPTTQTISNPDLQHPAVSHIVNLVGNRIKIVDLILLMFLLIQVLSFGKFYICFFFEN